MKRGDVWWVEFDPSVGSEITKTRPAVIVSNDAANRNLARVVVVPFTSSTNRVYPGEALGDRGNPEKQGDDRSNHGGGQGPPQKPAWRFIQSRHAERLKTPFAFIWACRSRTDRPEVMRVSDVKLYGRIGRMWSILHCALPDGLLFPQCKGRTYELLRNSGADGASGSPG